MTSAWHKFTASLFGWIPDISAQPRRRQVTIGIIVSVLLHLLLLAIFIILGMVLPKRVDFAQTKLANREIELTVEPPPELPIPFTITPNPDRPFIDSRGLEISTDPADKAIFESDENMKAASEETAAGDAPLPTQSGKDRPFNAFKTQKSLLGAAAQPFESAMPVPPLDEPTPTAPPPPKVADTPVPNATPPPKDEPQKETPKLTGTPPPFKTVEIPKDDEIALSPKAPATPVPVVKVVPATPPPVPPVATPMPVQEPPKEVVKLATPQPRPHPPQPQRESGFQPEQEQNHIEGNISNRGRKAVDSVATPMARYKKQVNDAIGSRWYYYIRERMDLIAFGSVRISFTIDNQGHVSQLKVSSNTSNESLADVSMRAVRDAELQPPPKDPSAGASNEPLDWSLTFTYYPFSQ